MCISAREEGLFERWRRHRSPFVKDGAVAETAFLQTKPSVLFLLKEVNGTGPDGGGWDLKDFLRDGGRGQTWNNIARWTSGLISPPGSVPWNHLDRISSEFRRSMLRRAAVMNLKKTPGGSTTSAQEFRSVVETDSAFILEQFGFYKADVVVCCGGLVKEAFDTAVRTPAMRDWRRTKGGVDYCEYEPGKHVLSYYHPQARLSKQLLYDNLVGAALELRQ